MPTTPNLLIEHIAANQAQKEVTANAAFDALDKALCQLTSIAILDVDATLTDAQMLGSLSMKLTGTLTAGRTVTIPAKPKLLMVENATTGGFAVGVKTPAGTAITINAGERKLLYCDGTTFQIVAETAVGATIPYDIGGTLAGVPTGGSVVLRYPVPRAVRFPAGMANSRGVAGSDSTYNYSNTVGQRDTLDCGNLPAITGGIFGVQVNMAARKDDAGGRTFRSLTRVSGTDYEGDSQNVGTDYRYFRQIIEKNPNTTAAWTESEINTAEFGYKLQA